eukprot:3309269-Pleurochrysis_carterae.AAC.1
MASAMGQVDGEREAVVLEALLAQLGDALQLGDLVAQPLVLRLELPEFLGHRLDVKEFAVGLDL